MIKMLWILLLAFQTYSIKATETPHHRAKRYLLYPFQGTFKTVYSFAIPMKLGPKQEMGIGWNFQFQYPLPYNTTAISSYPQVLSRAQRDKRAVEDEAVSDRATFYHGVERLLEEQGINGRECMLKTICENADYTHFDDDSGLLGQILHVFLSPNDENGNTPGLDLAYAEAQKAGEYGVDCETMFTKCNLETSFFNWFAIHGK